MLTILAVCFLFCAFLECSGLPGNEHVDIFCAIAGWSLKAVLWAMTRQTKPEAFRSRNRYFREGEYVTSLRNQKTILLLKSVILEIFGTLIEA